MYFEHQRGYILQWQLSISLQVKPTICGPCFFCILRLLSIIWQFYTSPLLDMLYTHKWFRQVKGFKNCKRDAGRDNLSRASKKNIFLTSILCKISRDTHPHPLFITWRENNEQTLGRINNCLVTRQKPVKGDRRQRTMPYIPFFFFFFRAFFHV